MPLWPYPDLTTAGWRKVRLPHDWLVGQDFDTDGLNAQGFFRRGYAWYRKEFRLLSDCRGKQILLCFDGIAGKSEIYINGSLIKRNFSSYNTFTVDITDRVYHGDRTNTVAVFVDRRDVELWAYEGAGIHRHAWLYIKDAVQHRAMTVFSLRAGRKAAADGRSLP